MTRMTRFKRLTRLICVVITLFFIFAQNFVILQASASDSIASSFIIKLISYKNYDQLVQVGTNVKKRFAESNNQQFQNIYTFDSIFSANDLKSYLAGNFVYLEEQKVFKTQDVFANDPGFTTDSRNIDRQWGLARAGFNAAWQKTTGSTNNIVAIVDTGIDETHEDLRGASFAPGFDFISRQPIVNGADSDDNGHGTLVAGILGARANNAIGIAGANWQITLMPLKALDASGKGDAVSVSEALVWAADHGAQFINLSLGGLGFGHDTTLANAITYAFNKNLLMVAAAGNDAAADGGNLDINPVFPVCDDNNFNMVIGVAATDQNDIKTQFSNFGKNCIDVTAPGKRILSTINFDPLTQRPSPNSYAYGSGTSLAVPFVVGEAALIRSLYPQATNVQIRDRIISTAESVDGLNLSQCGGSCRWFLGAGRINAAASLKAEIAFGFKEGDLIKVSDLNGAVYEIIGGQRRLVSPFVYNQRFAAASFKSASFRQLSNFPEGSYVTPTDGTLVKYDLSPTVYYIQNGQKFPVTFQVFKQRGLSFSSVNTLSVMELDSWVTAGFLAPAEGSLLKTAGSKTVYWVVGQMLHPINYKFFVERGLSIFPIFVISEADINGFAKGEGYIR